MMNKSNSSLLFFNRVLVLSVARVFHSVHIYTCVFFGIVLIVFFLRFKARKNEEIRKGHNCDCISMPCIARYLYNGFHRH